MGDKLKIAVACGGTGGHIFPGLATGRELLDRGHDVTLWLAGNDIEHDAVSDWPREVITVAAEGFQFGLSMRSVRTAFRLHRAYRTALPLMRISRPDAVLAMGSYASFAPVTAARRLRIPYVLHEANLLPGRAVSLLARGAAAVAISFEKSRYHIRHGNIVTTGMPLRKALQCSGRPVRRRDGDAPQRILVMGGSRGARVLNDIVPKAIVEASKRGLALRVVHLVGLNGVDEVRALYAEGGVEAEVQQFVQHMETVYPTVDLAVCRAGAATCAELACYGLPALLIPYPTAVRDHQMSNARVLQDTCAADVVAENDLTESWLRDYLVSVLQNPDRLAMMSAAMAKRAQPDAAGRLADLLESVAGAGR